MDVIFHGATKEVGRSCIELITEDKRRFLLDAGIKLSEKGTEFPSTVSNPQDIKAVFLSHAHLDHNGYLPVLDSQGLRCPIFATEPTKIITRMILTDAFKIGKLKHTHLGYVKEDIEKALSWMRKIRLDSEGDIEGAEFEFMDAGHIPGAASILLDLKDNSRKKRVLYTGDFKVSDTRLLNGSEIMNKKLGDIDLLITEATYGNRDHPDREKEEDNLINEIKSVTESKGSVIIPVFAEGRAQEILLILNKIDMKFDVPVYLDGMAIEATRIAQDFPDYVKDVKKLNNAVSKVNLVKGRIQREKIVKEPGIFITTSGMLTGGPVMDYMKNLCQKPENSVLMTGYQGEHTNGRLLLQEGAVFIDGWKIKVACKFKQFDFSAHSSQSELKEVIKRINPKEVAIQHGDPDAVLALAEWADVMGYKTHSPYMDERINIK